MVTYVRNIADIKQEDIEYGFLRINRVLYWIRMDTNIDICSDNNVFNRSDIDMDSLKDLVEKIDEKMGVYEYDVVDNPKHYCSGAHECIDVMEELFGTQAVADFCRCNIFKYRFRAAQKNGEEDISKAEWYENKLMELNRKLRGEEDDN